MRISHGPVQADLIGLVDSSRRRLVLVSPYIDLWDLLIHSINRAAARGVEITLIARGGADADKHARALRRIESSLAFIGFVERLHAKIYLNEEAAMLTSMNLVAGSALSTIEVSAFIEKRWAPKDYGQLRRICDALIETSKEDRLRTEPPKDEERSAGTRTGGRAPKWGHCIRCSERLAFFLDLPLCPACHSSWQRFKNKDYEERYCHKCGEECATTFREPICEDC